MRTLLLALCCVASVPAADYYVSPSGNDTANGTSTSTPWRTVAKVTGRNFAAGDRIFFQGGQTFTDAELYFDSGDTGTAANPIVVGSYGTGRATLQPPATKHAINIYNTAGLHIRDLILVGPGAAASDTNGRRGVNAYCDLASGAKLAYLRLENLDVSSFHEGITIGAWHSSFSGFKDVLITNCVIHDNLGNGMTTYGYQPGSATQQSHANVQVVGCEIMRNYGDPTLPNPADQHSGSGIILSGMKGGLVDRCYAHHNGGGAGDNAGGGPVGIWTYASDSVVIQRSLVHNQQTTAGAADGGGFDIDGGATNAVVQYCYSYNNDGPGFLVAEYPGAMPLQNGTFRYNISWRDGRRTAMNMASGFHFWSGENLPSECQDIRVYNNLVYTENATGGPCVRYQSGPMAGIRLWNNIFVVQGGEIFVNIGSNTGSFTFQNNLYWSTDNNWAGGWRWGGTTYTSLSAWRAATGTPETLAGTAVGLQADPLVNALVAGAQPTSVAQMEAMTAFQLLASSPAINAGADLRTAAYGSLDVGARDFWNSTLPLGGAFDIGPHDRTWEVGYHPNGATSGAVPAAQAKAVSVNLTVAGNSGSLARTGYAFSGWNTAADGGGTLYAAGGTYSGNASAILYALWTPSGGNTAPTITTTKPASLTTTEDTAATVSLAATDANGDALTWSVLAQGAKGVAAISGTGSPKNVTYTPTANLNGADSFAVQVSDGKGGTDTITVHVSIAAVNDPPICTVAPTTSGTSTVGRAQTATSGTWSDGDGTVAGFAYQWQRALGAGVFSDIAGASAATYTPVASDAGYSLRVQVTATDTGTPGTAGAVAVSAATLVKARTASPTVSSPAMMTSATPTLAGTSLGGATIGVYDGDVLVGTVAADGAGFWTWTPAVPLSAGTHVLTVTAELAPAGESSAVGPVTVMVGGGTGTGTSVIGHSGGGGGGCGSGGVLGLLALGQMSCLVRRRRGPMTGR